ncbi:MAG TPA: hypothetical protein VIL63_13710, partial [Terriglobales bacterium]
MTLRESLRRLREIAIPGTRFTPLARVSSLIALASHAGFGQNRGMKDTLTEDSALLNARSRFRAALILAIAADALQLLIIPLFAEGAL